MSPQVFECFASIAAQRLPADRRTLEVGAGGWTLLSMPALATGTRVALNLRFNPISEQLQETELVIGTAIICPSPTIVSIVI